MFNNIKDIIRLNISVKTDLIDTSMYKRNRYVLKHHITVLHTVLEYRKVTIYIHFNLNIYCFINYITVFNL